MTDSIVIPADYGSMGNQNLEVLVNRDGHFIFRMDNGQGMKISAAEVLKLGDFIAAYDARPHSVAASERNLADKLGIALNLIDAHKEEIAKLRADLALAELYKPIQPQAAEPNDTW
jgi:hypothetical protein